MDESAERSTEQDLQIVTVQRCVLPGNALGRFALKRLEKEPTEEGATTRKVRWAAGLMFRAESHLPVLILCFFE